MRFGRITERMRVTLGAFRNPKGIPTQSPGWQSPDYLFSGILIFEHCDRRRSAGLHPISMAQSLRGLRKFAERGLESASRCAHIGASNRSGVLNPSTPKRTKVRAPLVAAWPRCAVSRICNPQGVASSKRLRVARHLAECNSAIQQIENLRYEAQRRSA